MQRTSFLYGLPYNKIRFSKIVRDILLVGLILNLVTVYILVPSSYTSGLQTLDSGISATLPETPDQLSSASQEIMGQFYENVGQISDLDILYFGHIQGGMIGFAKDRVVLWLEGADDSITLFFVDARGVQPIGLNPSTHYSNYFLGDRGTYTDVRCFDRVVYNDLWLGIDLIYLGTDHGAKYEFHVDSGVDPSHIRIQVQGQDTLNINEESLEIAKDQALLSDSELFVFQDDRIVEAHFQNIDSSHYGFVIGDYDITKELVIDPLMFSTYLGGSEEDVGFKLAIDPNNNIIVVGWTYSSDFPFLAGYNDTFGGGRDIFVAKFNSVGGLLFTTYVGGNAADIATGVEVDPDGNIYVTGYSWSPDFPTTPGANNESINGGSDIIVLRLSPSGSSLVYSTFIGGSANDAGINLSLDPTSFGIGGAYVFVCGFTRSNDFPTKSGFDYTCTPATWDADGFALALNVSGDSLLWSFVMNGSWDDAAYDIEYHESLDHAQFVYIAGYTDSAIFPITEGVYQEESADQYDCFVMRINAAATQMIYSTYIGGNSIDHAFGMVIDHNSAAYIVGDTGDHFPTTSGTFGESFNGGGQDTAELGGDGFIAKLSPQGTTLEFASYIGGSGDDQVTGLLLDSQSNLIITGTTSSEDFPMVSAHYNTFNGGETDCFIAKINYDCTKILYSTYFGGNGSDKMRIGIGFTSNNDIVFCGHTNSTDFPILGDSIWDSSYNGNLDTFLARFSNDMISPTISSVERDISEPTEEDTVTVTATITDDIDVDTVMLSHRSGGDWNLVKMHNVAGNNWTGVIPTYPVGSEVEYRIKANDTSNNDVLSSFMSYTVIAADNTGPYIVTSHTPSEKVTENDAVVVTATISDDSEVVQAKLSFSVDDNVSWANVSMTEEGAQWTAGISRQPVGTTVQYKVYAVDSEGNWAESESSSYTVVSSIDYIAFFIMIGQIGTAIGVIYAGGRYIRKRMKRKVPSEET